MLLIIAYFFFFILGKLEPGLFGFLKQLHREKKIRKFYFSRGYRFLKKKLQFMVQRKWLYKNNDKISSWRKSSQKIGNIYNDECYKTNQCG